MRDGNLYGRGRARRCGETGDAGSVRRGGHRKSELGRRMGKGEKEIRRILGPKHPTKLPAMVDALRALGKRLVIGVEEAA
jgi:hypothetical protein